MGCQTQELYFARVLKGQTPAIKRLRNGRLKRYANYPLKMVIGRTIIRSWKDQIYESMGLSIFIYSGHSLMPFLISATQALIRMALSPQAGRPIIVVGGAARNRPDPGGVSQSVIDALYLHTSGRQNAVYVLHSWFGSSHKGDAR